MPCFSQELLTQEASFIFLVALVVYRMATIPRHLPHFPYLNSSKMLLSAETIPAICYHEYIKFLCQCLILLLR